MLSVLIRVGAMWISVLMLVTFTSILVNGYLFKKMPGLCPTPEEAGFESEATNIYAEHVAQMVHPHLRKGVIETGGSRLSELLNEAKQQQRALRVVAVSSSVGGG